MKKKLDIFCTLGPSSLNKKFLKFSNSNISLLRLNLSHLKATELPKLIKKFVLLVKFQFASIQKELK